MPSCAGATRSAVARRGNEHKPERAAKGKPRPGGSHATSRSGVLLATGRCRTGGWAGDVLSSSPAAFQKCSKNCFPAGLAQFRDGVGNCDTRSGICDAAGYPEPPSPDAAKRPSTRMSKRKQLESTPPPIGERLLTLREAAEVLRLNPRTVRAYAQRGELQGRIIGGKWRFRRADLDAFYENAPRQWDFVRKAGDGD